MVSPGKKMKSGIYSINACEENQYSQRIHKVVLIFINLVPGLVATCCTAFDRSIQHERDHLTST